MSAAETTDVSALKITLFGPMQVLVEGRPLPHLRSRRGQWLLALLTLRHGRPVAREWLAGTLWPEADQSLGYANLRPILSDLRSRLGSQGERLQSPDRHTLMLSLGGADVDVVAFDAAIKSRNLTDLKQAVELYRGPLLEGCPEEWVFQERAARELDCLQALQTLADAALASGDFPAASGYYQRAVLIDPLWDTARRGWMEALERGGDRNAALQVYREFVELLRSDPTATPDEQTTALYTRLRAEARSRMRPQVAAAAPVPEVSFPKVHGYLPHALTDLVGREEECLEVTACLQRSRLVTLTGPGGIGKTRLAIEVADMSLREYPDGVWLVSLESLSEGRQVVSQIASVLGLREETGRSVLETLTGHLRTKRLLLLLDNCEHLLQASAHVCAQLLRECGRVNLLATSREALGITGETVWQVPALAAPDVKRLPKGPATLLRVLAGYESVQLFVERAQSVQKGFVLVGSNAAAVAQVCSHLEGIPLAIELAAARVTALTVEQIAARLDACLSLLVGRNRSAQSRQQTLRATLDWSYNLLAETERTMLRHLSVFAGGWTLEGAEQVGSGETIEPGQVLNLLQGLVDKSLVVFEEPSGEDGGRYHLLETVRQYAGERLQADNEREWVRGRHRAWLMALAAAMTKGWHGPEQGAWLRRLEAEYDNLRATLAWEGAAAEDPEADLRLLGWVWIYWDARGLYSEGRDYLKRALAREGASAPTLARAHALRAAATLCCDQGDFTEATQMLYAESLAITRLLGDKQATAQALHGMSHVAQAQGDSRTAIVLLEECLSLCREMGNPNGIAFATGALGIVYFSQGDCAKAQALQEETLLFRRRLGDPTGIAYALNDLGQLASFQGAWATAEAFLEESARLFGELRYKRGLMGVLGRLGNVALEQGQYDRAAGLFEEAHNLSIEIGSRLFLGFSLANLAKAACFRGDFQVALALHREGLTIRQETDDRRGIVESLTEIAAVLAAAAAQERAAQLLGAAQRLRESLGVHMPPHDQGRYDRQVEQSRLALGESRFGMAWDVGYAMTWEQATAYALEPNTDLTR